MAAADFAQIIHLEHPRGKTSLWLVFKNFGGGSQWEKKSTISQPSRHKGHKGLSPWHTLKLTRQSCTTFQHTQKFIQCWPHTFFNLRFKTIMSRRIITSTSVATTTEKIHYIWAASNYHPHTLYIEIYRLSNTFHSVSQELITPTKTPTVSTRS